jgi:hypothetical protein
MGRSGRGWGAPSRASGACSGTGRRHLGMPKRKIMPGKWCYKVSELDAIAFNSRGRAGGFKGVSGNDGFRFRKSEAGYFRFPYSPSSEALQGLSVPLASAPQPDAGGSTHGSLAIRTASLLTHGLGTAPCNLASASLGRSGCVAIARYEKYERVQWCWVGFNPCCQILRGNVVRWYLAYLFLCSTHPCNQYIRCIKVSTRHTVWLA